MSPLGEPLSRVDGKLKVTGSAKYSAEFEIPQLAYAVMVQSTIPSGRIARMDTSAAERIPGVVAVLKPGNALELPGAERRVSVLQDDLVHYDRQPVAVVVAETLEQAHHAASMVRVEYAKADAKLNFDAGFPTSYPGSHNGIPGDLSFGDVDAGLRQAEITIDQVYTTPIQHHNPMEPHATIAKWDGDHLSIHDATQHISGVQETLAKMFAIPKENVHVTCLFVGGGFGCKGQVWSHVILAALAAKQTNRPVKLVLERPQMFGPVGARPRTHQKLTLGATRDGKLTAIRHEVHANTSEIEDYLESSAFPTRVMYSCPNVATIHRLVPLNLGTPTYMRAPGVATGTYAVEVAMDELAYELEMDPLQLRLINYTDVDPHTKVPFSEKNLRGCYSRAADRFGWSKRSHGPQTMREGKLAIGWGMATETYPGKNLPAAALVRLQPDGTAVVASGTQEIGNGIYTVMTEVAADTLKMSPRLFTAVLGDTNLPPAPISAGSMTTASVGPAVREAALRLRSQLIAIASRDAQSPLHGADESDVELQDGKMFLRSAPGRSDNFKSLLARHGNRPVEASAQVKPGVNENQYSVHSFGAVFAEVAVDPDVRMVRVQRVVAVFDVGKVLNEKLGRSQFIGGIVWGISLALFEDTHVDWRNGRIINANLADYLVPVNRDIGEIDVSTLDIPDTKLDSLGARGIGEIGITGTGAAVANAVFHATGKRVRDLPITPDKLL
ncbi:MAG TPA: xanthine dehydrogenase family protein molybdopterin-binding subunit [Terriglobales bacterium]|jgi:xanthine dehydrogenase YagR molybdenum-binding subunit|nr:xanthine dehydrogenase family protein molybdopterin-binding subunit [Terriglobales bacterium]